MITNYFCPLAASCKLGLQMLLHSTNRASICGRQSERSPDDRDLLGVREERNTSEGVKHYMQRRLAIIPSSYEVRGNWDHHLHVLLSFVR
jgi:hypothetical protein